MTAHIDIADSEIDPESPGTTTVFTKLRDNPIATYEGNNPTKIVYAALNITGGLVAADKSDSAAGDVKMGGALSTIITNSSLNGGYIDGLQYFIIPNNGEFRLAWDQRFTAATGGGESITVRIYRNGSNVGTSTSSTAVTTNWFARTIDISGWTNGDELSIWTSFAGGSTNTAEIRNFYIKESAPIVAATQIRG